MPMLKALPWSSTPLPTASMTIRLSRNKSFGTTAMHDGPASSRTAAHADRHSASISVSLFRMNTRLARQAARPRLMPPENPQLRPRSTSRARSNSAATVAAASRCWVEPFSTITISSRSGDVDASTDATHAFRASVDALKLRIRTEIGSPTTSTLVGLLGGSGALSDFGGVAAVPAGFAVAAVAALRTAQEVAGELQPGDALRQRRRQRFGQALGAVEDDHLVDPAERLGRRLHDRRPVLRELLADDGVLVLGQRVGAGLDRLCLRHPRGADGLSLGQALRLGGRRLGGA